MTNKHGNLTRGVMFSLLKRNNWGTVSDSKLHVFQYKILHRILPCKYSLCKWKIIDNDKCTHCNEIETFIICSQAKSFIKQIENWINRTYGKHYTFSITDFLFGIPSTRLDKFIKITNWIIIYAKWYMYSCNLTNEVFFATFSY